MKKYRSFSASMLGLLKVFVQHNKSICTAMQMILCVAIYTSMQGCEIQAYAASSDGMNITEPDFKTMTTPWTDTPFGGQADTDNGGGTEDRPFAGWFQENGIWGYRTDSGELLRSQWFEYQGEWYYLNENGHMATGWHSVDGNRYYFQSTGELATGWCLDWESHNWYYYDKNRVMHTGWLNEGDAWYWFDSKGEMVYGGYRTIEGVRYYFFNDGQMASNQYIGMHFYNAQGQEDKRYDIQLVGDGKVTQQDRDMVSDGLYLYPRKWIAAFVNSGWSFQYYTEKSFFEAPDTDQGVYYLYHELDTKYKKLKICKSDSMVRAFGEYVAYASGVLKKESTAMQKLRSEQVNLDDLLEIPDYYDSDDGFYFGALCEAYFDDVKRREMEQLAPLTCETLRGILFQDSQADYSASSSQ